MTVTPRSRTSARTDRPACGQAGASASTRSTSKTIPPTSTKKNVTPPPSRPHGVDRTSVHGGGWQVGSRKFYTNWGHYLARNGFAVFAIEYRLMKPGVQTYPGAVYDTRAAVQFVRRSLNGV